MLLRGVSPGALGAGPADTPAATVWATFPWGMEVTPCFTARW